MADVQPVPAAEPSSPEVANGNAVTEPATMEEDTGDKQGVKRPAEEQIGPDDVKKDAKAEEPGEFPKACDDVMAHRMVLAPVPSLDQEEDEDGAFGGAKPFKLNPPTLIHGIAKPAPMSDEEEEEEEPVKPLLRPSALNHHVKEGPFGMGEGSLTGAEEMEEEVEQKAEKTRLESSESAANVAPENNCETESEASKRTNYFLRLNAGNNERDLGFGVFGKFRDPSAYRIGFEEQDGKGASGNGGIREQDHDGGTHENYFMQFTSKRDKDLNSAGDSPSSLSSSSGSSFLFGQNMNERVTSPNRQEGELQSAGELVFGQNLASRIKHEGFNEISPEKTKEQTLAENANALEEAKERMKRKFEDVESKTGEEDEENVLQSHCKLFVFDHNKRSWLERGRGHIRLNDKPALSKDSSFQSRLVMRTQGSLRLILNTKLWNGMTIEKASQKSIRLSALDAESETVKVFLVTGTPKDIEQLYCAIEYRVQALKHVDDDRQRLDTDGVQGAEGGIPDPSDLHVNDEEDGEDEDEDDDDDDEDEDSEVAKLCSRDRSKPASPNGTAESASASPAILPEDS